MVNAHIVVAVVVITAGGFLRFVTHTASEGTTGTRILLGGYVLMLALSVLDLFGGAVSVIAGAIAMLAAFVVLFTEIPWATIFNIGKQPTIQPLTGGRAVGGTDTGAIPEKNRGTL